MPPDVYAELIMGNTGLADYKEALAWFYEQALAAIPERRNAAVKDARYRLIQRTGHVTFFHYRNAMAVSQGHKSYWYYRKAKGWPENRYRWRPNGTVANRNTGSLQGDADSPSGQRRRRGANPAH